MQSLRQLGVAHGCDACVLLGHIVVNALVVESGQRRTDVVALTHLEVLAEVLVTAPPVGVDHAEALVTPDLMEVRVAHVVLLAVNWEAAVLVGQTVLVVGLADTVAEVLNHLLLLVLDHDVQQETLVEMEDQTHPHEADTVLSVEGAHLPVGVGYGVLEEARDILERSPLLGVVTGLLSVVHELAEVAVGFLSKGSATVTL